MINLAYDTIKEIIETSTIIIGGKTNNKGENLCEYILMTDNNTYTSGYAMESWFNSNKDSLNENDCPVSSIATSFGFGIVCFSDGCLGIILFSPVDEGSSNVFFS